MTRPKSRLKKSESQSWDRDRKNIVTKTKVVETIKDETSKFGSRLISEICWDQDLSRLKIFIDVETETHGDWEILQMSRLRFIETRKFHRCRDRDLSIIRNIMVVETETSRDWAKDVDTETPSRLMLISDMIRVFWLVGLYFFLPYRANSAIKSQNLMLQKINLVY